MRINGNNEVESFSLNEQEEKLKIKTSDLLSEANLILIFTDCNPHHLNYFVRQFFSELFKKINEYYRDANSSISNSFNISKIKFRFKSILVAIMKPCVYFFHETGFPEREGKLLKLPDWLLNIYKEKIG